MLARRGRLLHPDARIRRHNGHAVSGRLQRRLLRLTTPPECAHDNRHAGGIGVRIGRRIVGIGEASAGPRSPQSRDPTHRSRRGCARYLRRGLWRRAAHAAGAQRPQGASAPHGETQSSIRRRAFRDDPEKPCRALALATSDAHVSAASAPGLHELPGRDGGRSSVHQSSTGPRNCAAAPLTRRRGYREARLFAGTSLTPEDAPRTPDLLRIRQYLDRQPGNEKSVDLQAFSSG